MAIPNWLKGKLDGAQLQQIAEAVKRAESTTSGEIVPMIVRKSSTLGHVPVILFSLFVAVFFAADGPSLQAEFVGDHVLLYFVDTVVIVILTALLGRSTFVQRLLTTRADQIAQVEMRAEIEFYGSDIRKTRDATGILLFVSLLERRAVVLADQAISEKVPKDTWLGVCDILISGIKKKNMGSAFGNAVEKCGEILTPLFPIKPDDENELKDHLVIKE